MVKLSDEELSAVMQAAAPLEPDRRSDFLARVAAELASIPDEARGVGVAARLARAVQRDCWDAPDLSRGHVSSLE
jgi:hypothetical protein